MIASLYRVLAWLILVTLLLVALPVAQPSVAAQLAASPVRVSPATLEATVALGEEAEVRLRVENEATESIDLRIFEARAEVQAVPEVAPRLRRVPLPSEDRGVAAATRGPVIDPGIATDQANDPEGKAQFLVFLGDQAELAAAYALRDWASRGAYVATTLQNHADASQRALRGWLDARGLPYTPLWIVNALAVTGDAADVAALASRAEVAELRALRVASLGRVAPRELAQTAPANCAADDANVCWHVRQVEASRTWNDFGVRGTGITVASIDSGVRLEHPALVNQYRGTSAEGQTHAYNWLDLFGSSPSPADAGNHGTHTMGLMVGLGDQEAQPAVGIAPASRWIAVRACSARECNELALIQAAQWLLAPTDTNGLNARPDLRPHIINNSWVAGATADWYTGYVVAWRAAGIYPVFAAGNTGSLSGCGTIQAPASFAEVTAVGATDRQDLLATFSSIGPTADGRIKPDLTAPGLNIISTVADQRIYGSLSGTSMATPIVAGAVALLWSSQPGLIGDYEATYAALTATAAPRTGDTRFLGDLHATCRPDEAPNSIYGYGRLDAYGAVAEVSVDIPWLSIAPTQTVTLAPGATIDLAVTVDARKVAAPGRYTAQLLLHTADLSQAPLVIPVTLVVPSDASHATLRGTVTRGGTGATLEATVSIADGPTITTDTRGAYQFILPTSQPTVTLTTSARDHVSQVITVSLSAGEEVVRTIVLQPDQPQLTVDRTRGPVVLDFAETLIATLPISNTGPQPLRYTAQILDEAYGVWRSDETPEVAGEWIVPPEDAVTVALGNDALSEAVPIGFPFLFYHRFYETLSISSNGLLILGSPPSSGFFIPGCFPLAETTGAAIVPLRVNLDPSQPGARVSYASLAEGLLVSWEEVPISGEPTQRLSFQVLLMRDGRISMHYKTIGPLAPELSASYGLQASNQAYQSLGCRSDLLLNDGLTIELRTQPTTSTWVEWSDQQGEIAPGEAADLPIALRWVSPSFYPWGFRGTILIQSNDPLAPVTRLPITIAPENAPYRVIFPMVW